MFAGISWEASRGASLAPFVASWGLLGAAWGLLGASWGGRPGFWVRVPVLGASWAVLGRYEPS
eukprot:1516015-Pyramimonas_sp.AAC.1